MLRAALLAMILGGLGCPAPKGEEHPVPAGEHTADPYRVLIAQLEAHRAAGVDQLVELARESAPTTRVLALRALGRIGGKRALEVVRAALSDPDPPIVTAAAGALGVAASLDDPSPADVAPLVAALAHGDRQVVIEALGRVAPGPLPELTAALHDDATAEVAALAAGRLGRRKIAIDAPTRDALVALSAHAKPAVRYAAVYALAREIVGDVPRPEVADALVARIADGEPEIRAQAIAGLAKHDALVAAKPADDSPRWHAAIASSRKAIEEALLDRDWRVAVEAIRALCGDHGDDAGRDAVAAALLRRFAELEKGKATEAQVVIEGLRELEKFGTRPLVTTALGSLAASASRIPTISGAWIECLALAGTAHATGDLAAVEKCRLPPPQRLQLVADLIAAKVGTVEARRDALGRINKAHEPRVLEDAAAVALASEGDDLDRYGTLQGLLADLRSKDGVRVGAAADAIPALYGTLKQADRETMDAAIIRRTIEEQDPELAAALLELVGDKKIPAGVDVCRAALAGHPVRQKAGAKCLAALGEAVPAPAIGAAEPPPLDVASVIGKDLHWHVVTNRGEIVIALRPDVAPWAVAAIVSLAQKGFYDRLEFHRVVPDFVVQGGDPTMTGSGGPGFVLPAEPTIITDGPGYAAGGIGMADAGRDSAGSQWFAMHSRAPHLDGRYTWVGVVERGQDVANALQIGDRVERTTIESR